MSRSITTVDSSFISKRSTPKCPSPLRYHFEIYQFALKSDLFTAQQFHLEDDLFMRTRIAYAFKNILPNQGACLELSWHALDLSSFITHAAVLHSCSSVLYAKQQPPCFLQC